MAGHLQNLLEQLAPEQLREPGGALSVSHDMVAMAETETRLNDDWRPLYGRRSAGAVGQAIAGNAAVCPPAVNVIAAGR